MYVAKSVIEEKRQKAKTNRSLVNQELSLRPRLRKLTLQGPRAILRGYVLRRVYVLQYNADVEKNVKEKRFYILLV